MKGKLFFLEKQKRRKKKKIKKDSHPERAGIGSYRGEFESRDRKS